MAHVRGPPSREASDAPEPPVSKELWCAKNRDDLDEAVVHDDNQSDIKEMKQIMTQMMGMMTCMDGNMEDIHSEMQSVTQLAEEAKKEAQQASQDVAACNQRAAYNRRDGVK